MKKILSFALAAMMAIPMMASAHGPSRQKVVETIVINASPEKVWAMVGDFQGLHNWHPAITETKMKDDKTRVLFLAQSEEDKDAKKDVSTITEELKKLDDEKMMIKYKIIDMSVKGTEEHLGKTYDVPAVPVHNYLSIITVKAVDGGSEVTWMGKFYRVFPLNYEKTGQRYPKGLGDEEGVTAITGIFKSGLENLKKICEAGDC